MQFYAASRFYSFVLADRCFKKYEKPFAASILWPLVRLYLESYRIQVFSRFFEKKVSVVLLLFEHGVTL